MPEYDATTLQSITDRYEITNPYLIRMHKEAEEIQKFIEIPACLEDPASLTYRLRDMSAYMARLGDMLCRAKSMKECAKNAFLSANMDKLAKLNTTEKTRIISAYVSEFSITYDRLELLYSTIKDLNRDLITQISYIKQQMSLG